jgi:uncharacterized protein YndB with AHSA1/START domain
MSVTELGQLREDGERCAVHFERVYDFTADELWAALTDPEQLAGWLAHVHSLELAVGGAVRLDFGEGDEVRGEVLELEAGHVLAYTWTYSGEVESIVRFELVPREHGTLLVLDHRRLERDVSVAYGAGWHAHLDLLAAALHGRSLEFMPRYLELRPPYEERAAELGPDWAGPGGTELLEALAAGDDERAVELATRHPHLRLEPDEDGLLPAMRALYLRGRELAETLAPPEGATDVFLAAALGRVPRLRTLLDEDAARARSFSPDGFTPLHLACFSGGAEAVRVLIEHDAPLEELARSPFARVRPLGTAAFSRALDCSRELLDSGADPNGTGEGGFVPLHTAAQNGDLELVRLLLERGADPSRTAPDGRTPERLARDAGHEGVADVLAGRV